MASSGYSAPTPPVFFGEGYAIWAVKMKAYLKAFDLWEATEIGRQPGPLREDPTLAQIKAHSEECAKGFKALSCIHASVSEVIFSRNMACETAKQAWDLLKAEFQGSEQTKQMSILNLRREFEECRVVEALSSLPTPPRDHLHPGKLHSDCPNLIIFSIEHRRSYIMESKKQDVVAQSTTEVEYISAAAAANQSIWFRKLMVDLGVEQVDPTVICCDSKSAIAIAIILFSMGD
ncbi:hypothetical protein GH714_021736 [Hevea brasiliensis]|uniref:Uncharacterized protein n=1 Tax=Hevea brasiliensis TaxID=3981 RepID=A0A6A6N2U6_HEVBR|nr:hypothetical protein GH714_021736 [Hevea brasiliensis]